MRPFQSPAQIRQKDIATLQHANQQQIFFLSVISLNGGGHGRNALLQLFFINQNLVNTLVQIVVFLAH
jgi:cadmium resistance protein CadD (predicted permease)